MDLILNGVSMYTPAWAIVDISQLWAGANVKGADTDVPHAHGGLPNPRHRATTVYSLPLNIYGRYNSGGTVYASQVNGLQQNIAALGSATRPVSMGDGTYAGTLITPAGGTLHASVTPLGALRVSADPSGAVARAVITFSIADGEFA